VIAGRAPRLQFSMFEELIEGIEPALLILKLQLGMVNPELLKLLPLPLFPLVVVHVLLDELPDPDEELLPELEFPPDVEPDDELVDELDDPPDDVVVLH